MHTKLVIAKLATMVLGFLIAYQAYRGYRRNNSQSMFYLAIGFGIVSIGAIIEGLLFDILGFTFHDSGMVATSIVAVGMLTILYALYGRVPRPMKG